MSALHDLTLSGVILAVAVLNLFESTTLPRRLPELLVPALESRPVGQVNRPAWQMDELPVDLLQPHDEHRAVRFTQDRRPHLDDVVGPNGEEEPIERRVMQLAQRHAVADDRLALDVAVGCDVDRVQELLGTERGVATIPHARVYVTQRPSRLFDN